MTNSKPLKIIQGVLVLLLIWQISPFLTDFPLETQGDEEVLRLKNEHQSRPYYHIPLRRVGRLLLLDAQVDSVSGAFVFDTGAQSLVLNSTYFRDAKAIHNQSGAGVTGGQIERKSKKIKHFSFDKLKFENVYADVIDLSHIENSKQTKILGLIGTQYFKNYEIIINVRKQSLLLFPIDKKGKRILAAPDSTQYFAQHKVQIINNVMITHLRKNNKKACFCLDTGAESNLLDFACPQEFLNSVKISGRRKLRGSGNQSIDVLYGQMPQLKIGTHQLDSIPFLITDLSTLSNAYGIELDGMLGFSIFEHQIVKLNFKLKEMSFAHFMEDTL
jgi:hypothetical protein